VNGAPADGSSGRGFRFPDCGEDGRIRWQNGRVAAKQLSMSYVQLGSIQASAPLGPECLCFQNTLPFQPHRPYASARRKLKLN